METPHGSSRTKRSLGQGLYQCTQCQRTYTRVDHLARHVRTHLQERPFQCETCHKGFGRPDLLKRHVQTHAGNGARRLRPNNSHSIRVSKACLACAASKVKCDDVKPCTRCCQLNIPCEHSDIAKAPAKGGAASAEKDEKQDIQYMDDMADAPNTNSEYEQRSVVTPTTMASTLVQIDHHHPIPSQSFELQPNTPGFPDNHFSDFLRDVMAPVHTGPFENYSQPNWSGPEFRSRNVLDFCMGPDFGFDLGDMGFTGQVTGGPISDLSGPALENFLTYDTPQTHIHLQEPPREPTTHRLPHSTPPTLPKREVGVGAEAFQRSYLARWLPAQQDNIDTQLDHLSQRGEGASPCETRISIDQRPVGEMLDTNARDKLLALILSTCDGAKGAAVAAVFPPRQLLDDLIQNYFSHDSKTSSSFIHAPTFNPNTERTELLGAIIATGAVLSDVKELQDLGFAVQEAIYITLPKRCEKANSVTRHLWLMQALACEIEIGLWSGNRRKMEIAESHTQTLFTMLRRAGNFQKCKSSAYTPSPEDTGAVLYQKWLNWVRQESRRRLVFHAFLLDAQASMSLLVNPVISYAEISTLLPESRDLWMAEDAEQWKALYLQQPGQTPEQPIPSLVSLLQRPSDFSCLPNCYDLDFAALSVLHGMWGMIWEYTQSCSILSSRLGPGTAATALRHQDLCSALEQLRMAIHETGGVHSPGVHLLLELLSMYLHVSLEKIQLFAGKEDLEEARHVLPALQEWATLPNSRQAVCSAGQVLCAAKRFPTGQLRNFYAIALYHASLTCWTYGLISQKLSISKEGPNISDVVHLDGPDTSNMQRFITLGRGMPVMGPLTTSMLGLTSGVIHVSDPAGLMGVILEVLRNNTAPQASGPPLVENLVQLMLDLGEAGASVVDR